MQSDYKMAQFDVYRQAAQKKEHPLHKQFVFYRDLIQKLNAVPYEDPEIQKALGVMKVRLEKVDFEHKKPLARLALELCESGTYIITDPKARQRYPANPTHKEIARAALNEAKNIVTGLVAFNFPQVDEGIKHLESLLA